MTNWLTTDEAAEQIPETAHSIAEKCKRGEIKAARLGRRWAIKQSDLDAFMASKVPVTAGRRSTIDRGVR